MIKFNNDYPYELNEQNIRSTYVSISDQHTDQCNDQHISIFDQYKDQYLITIYQHIQYRQVNFII